MKTPLFAASLACTLPLLGQTITVDFEISEGGTPLDTLTLEIDHANAPMAAASFIGLASGELSWIDSTTGVVQTNKPYFNGIKIHRTDLGFVSQFGSQKGDGSDGPGYTFPDEPDLGNLLHTAAYDLSMANSGPNSNGSQVFITAAKTDFLDSKHIVFGKVALGNSRTVADHINSVPVVDADGADNISNNNDDDNRPVTDLIITSATVHYNGVTFDPRAQGLPLVSAPALASPPSPDSTELFFTQPPRSTTSLHHSGDLTDWSSVGTRYLDGSDPGESTFPLLGGSAGNPTHFFAPSVVTYDTTALFPSDLDNRILTSTSGAADHLVTFAFDATGNSGTWSYLIESGPFDVLYFFPDGYGARIIIDAPGFAPDGDSSEIFDFRRVGFDTSTPTLLSGRNNGLVYPSFLHFQYSVPSADLSGTFTLTR